MGFLINFIKQAWSLFALAAGLVLFNINALPAFASLFVLRGVEAATVAPQYQTMGLGRFGIAIGLTLIGLYGTMHMIHRIAARRAADLYARQGDEA